MRGARVPGYVIVTSRPLGTDEVAKLVVEAREDWPDVEDAPMQRVSRFVTPGRAYLMVAEPVWSISLPAAPSAGADNEGGRTDG